MKIENKNRTKKNILSGASALAGAAAMSADDASAQGLEMQYLQDVVGYDIAFAQEDMPDYVNDSDVDVYMV